MAKSPKSNENTSGFEEAPQPPLSGAPLSDSVADWPDEVSKPAATEKKAKKPKLPAARSSKPTKSSRGTVMGGAASPKERAVD